MGYRRSLPCSISQLSALYIQVGKEEMCIEKSLVTN